MILFFSVGEGKVGVYFKTREGKVGFSPSERVKSVSFKTREESKQQVQKMNSSPSPKTDEEIKSLTPLERMAGYLLVQAKLAMVGAQLRHKYHDVKTSNSEGWNEEEERRWDEIADELDPWFYATSEEEKIAISPATEILGYLTRAEWPSLR